MARRERALGFASVRDLSSFPETTFEIRVCVQPPSIGECDTISSERIEANLEALDFMVPEPSRGLLGLLALGCLALLALRGRDDACHSQAWRSALKGAHTRRSAPRSRRSCLCVTGAQQRSPPPRSWKATAGLRRLAL